MAEELGSILKSKDLEGRVFQDYKLLQLVGTGGMAWVYKAEHIKFGEYLAVKVLQPKYSDDEDVRKRFLEEAKIQFKIRHPNVVQVSDIIEDGRIFGFVMDWAEGKNLKQVVQQLEKPVSRKDIWRVMLPVLDAVGFAHKQGLVHRDIKPANILLHQEGDTIIPKVADFGIAKALDDEDGKTATGMSMGTVKYMPPEQVMDAKRVDHRADIYALGVTLYMMATLRLPFEGRLEFVLYQQMNEDPAPPSSYNPNLSVAFDRVMMKALAKKPEDRFQSCAEFGHALSMALIDVEEIKLDPEELDTQKIYNMLTALPDENSIYQTTLTPLSPALMKQLYESHTPDTITQLQKFVLFGDETTNKQLRLAANNNKPEQTLSTEELGGETVMAPEGLSFDSSGKKNSLGIIVGVLISLLLFAGGGFYYKNSLQTDSPNKKNTKLTGKQNFVCKEGSRKACYTGKAGTRQKGRCKDGYQICLKASGNTVGKWGACQNQILPEQEVCDGKDNNCNGKIDETFPKKGQSCSVQVGECSFKGTYACLSAKAKTICKAAPTAKRTNKNFVQLHITPSSTAFKIRYKSAKKVNRQFKEKTCLHIKGRGTYVRISRRGYYTCSFYLSKRRGLRNIRMKRRNPNELDPPAKYCLR